MIKRSAKVLMGAFVALGVVVSYIWLKNNATADVAPLPSPNAERYRVPLGNAPSKGGIGAKVTIVEWGDFECPVSAQVAATLNRVSSVYKQDVRLVWKHRPLPFHRRALPSAEIAMAVREKRGESAFWRLHDLLFEHQGTLDRPALERYGRESGLSDPEIKVALDEKAYDAAIRTDADQARGLGARGWPVFYINGRPLSGAQPFDVFKKVIDEELANADRTIGQGTPFANLYDVLTRDAKAPASRGSIAAPAEERATAVVNLPIAKSPRRGQESAKVTVIEFGDFQCPSCKDIESTLARLEQAYSVDLRVVWKNNPLPFHRGAMPAAKAALAAAEQGKFWEMHDRLLADQQHLDEPTFVKYAQELGLDRKRFASAMTAKHVEAAIRDDVELAGSVGARATPSFFINGQPLLGEPTAKNLEMAVEATLRASRAASETRAALGTAAQQVLKRN